MIRRVARIDIPIDHRFVLIENNNFRPIKSGTSIMATAALTRYLFNPVRLEIESTKYE
jgi:hypothetical protein